MAIYKIQNCSSLKYLDSNIAQLSDFNSTNNQRPSVTVENSSSSISQKWVIDSFSGTTHIRSCIDHNICLGKFYNPIAGQCAMSLEHCYINYRYSSNPIIQFAHVSSGTYRIRDASHYNCYLTELSSGVASWEPLDTSNPFQIWTFQSASATTNYTLKIYQNMNQKCDIYNGTGKLFPNNQFFQYGCGICTFGNAAAYHHEGSYTVEEMAEDGACSPPSGGISGYYSFDYMNVSGEIASWSYSQIKQELNSGNPVIIRMGVPNDDKHYVLAYGYTGNCSSANQVFVLDPANTHNTLDDIGRLSTLSESFTWNSSTQINHIRTTSKKNSTS